MNDIPFVCPACNSNELMVKYEVKYVYSYIIDEDAPGMKNAEEFLPFMYDKREQKEAKQYIECNTCQSQYPCFFTEGNKEMVFKVLKKTTTDEVCHTIE